MLKLVSDKIFTISKAASTKTQITETQKRTPNQIITRSRYLLQSLKASFVFIIESSSSLHDNSSLIEKDNKTNSCIARNNNKYWWDYTNKDQLTSPDTEPVVDAEQREINTAYVDNINKIIKLQDDPLPYIQRLETSISKKDATEIANAYIALLNAGKLKHLTRQNYRDAMAILKKSTNPYHLTMLHQMFYDMETVGLTPRNFEYNQLIYATGVVHSQPDKSMEIYQQMLDQGIQLTDRTFNNLINAYKRNLDAEGALRVYKEMREKGVHPDIVTYNSLIDLFAKMKKMNKGREMYQEMMEIGVMPDMMTFSTLLSGYVDAGDMENAQSIYELIMTRSNGESKNLDYITLNTIIKYFAAKGETEKASNIYKDMLKSSTSLSPNNDSTSITTSRISSSNAPNIYTYNTLIDHHLKNHQFSDATNIFKQMIEQGVKPNPVTYSTYIEALLNAGDFKEATFLLSDYNEVNDDMSTNAPNKLKNLHTSINLLNQMRGYGHKPDTYLYNTMLNAQFELADYQGALETYRKMVQDNVKLNDFTYVTLIKISNQLGNHTEALKFYSALVSYLRRQQFEGGESYLSTKQYNQILASFARSLRMTEAQRVFNDLIRQRDRGAEDTASPDSLSYSILLTGFGYINDRESIRRIHNILNMDWRLTPTIQLYNALMNAYNVVGDGSQVFKIWDALWLSNQIIDVASISIILDNCAYNDYMWRIRGIWRDLKFHKFPLNTNNYNSFIEALARHSFFDEAIDVLTVEMAQDNIKPNAKSIRTILSMLHSRQRSTEEYYVISWVREKFPELARELKLFKEDNDEETIEKNTKK
ncbi:11342_t:CDS:2 [Ambispora leptoticha]|uniref:11342_t:CDS:1 n=1 Tax=Ambispora leptoticha TaxID=144679 RepID=A0A9N9B5U1_9GLOM|nr:11342_t:CDS:2 [Ambispora leptoticha]